MRTWEPGELQLLGDAEELHVTPMGADGDRRREVPVWVVRVGDGVFVRTWHRRGTGWYGQVLDTRRAQIRVPGLEAAVGIADVGDDGEERRAGVDAAYRVKYGRYGRATVERMVNDQAAASTLELLAE